MPPTTPRPEDFCLAQALRSPSFTPRMSESEALLALVVGDDEAAGKAAERALLRMGEKAARLIRDRMQAGLPRARARLCRLVGRLAQQGDDDARGLLLSLARDADPKTRRNAFIALGQLHHPEAEEALLRAWHETTRVDHLRSLAASLGKVGSAPALALLREVRTEDPELRRITGQALLTLSRTLERDTPSALDLHRTPPRPLPMALRCRVGLEDLLRDELRPEWLPEVLGPGLVRVTLGEAPEALFSARTLLRFGWLLGEEPVGPAEDPADAAARVLTSPLAREIFHAFTAGPPRFRLAFAGGGHRRAAVWRCAAAIHARCPELRNDPTESTWEAVVHERDVALRASCTSAIADDRGKPLVQVELCPRHPPDGRFAYRRGDVPAASHPTLAAALARVAGVRGDDVVWDPFVGSGLELAERGLLGPYAALYGSDRDARALAVARENLDAAGLHRVHLQRGDARTHAPPAPTLVITNPPMGRRVLRGEDLGDLLDAFVDHAARLLQPGGRLVWLSPLHRRTAERARRAGLHMTLGREVDMGGFTAELQAFRKPGG